MPNTLSRAGCRSIWITLLICPLLSSWAIADDSTSALTDLDHRVLKELTGKKVTGPLVLHYNPASITADQIATAAAANLRSFKELEKLLKMSYSGKVHIFLYRDGEDLKKQTKSDAVAFSTGTCSVHQPHDFVSVHELCHIFAMQFPRTPDGVCDIFVYEGLATALAESDQDVPIHSWAAVYARARRVPPLWEFRWKWPDKTPAGVHPYHVAGSFVGFLVERFDIDKVKEWYVNATEAQSVFGRSFPQLEKEWRDWLARRQVDPAHERHVLSQLGLLDARLPERIASASFDRIFNGKTLAGLDRESAKCWKLRDGQLVGTNDGPWTALHAAKRLHTVSAVRVRFRLVSGDASKAAAFKLALEPASGRSREAIFARWAVFLSCGDAYASSTDAAITDGGWHEAVMLLDKDGFAVYLDGLRVTECKEPPPDSDLRVGLGIERGVVEVSDWSYLPRDSG